MALWNKIVNTVKGNTGAEAIPEGFETAEILPEECEGCSKKYPSSLKIDTDTILYDTAPKPALQMLVATGEHDWEHDITDEQAVWGRVCKNLAGHSKEFEKIAGGHVRVNGTDQEFHNNPDLVSVIVLPHFVRIETTPETAVDDVLKVLKLTSTADPLPENCYSLKDKGYIMICSHGKRDKRCAVTAPILRSQLEIELRHEGLYRDADDDDPEGVRVVYCNHVGGHKFAANCFVYLNDGSAVLMARIRPEHARVIVQKTIMQGVVFPEYTKNCAKLKAFEW